MSRIAEQAGLVTGGVDTHADVHVAAVVDPVGRVLGTRAFPADASGYAGALVWMRAHGELAKVGVEGTGSYGAGLARTQAGNQLRDLILTAPEPLRQQLAGLPSGRQVDVAARFRPGGPACPAEGAKAAMASVARRHQQLTAEITRLDTMLDELVRHAAPEGFLAKRGVATQVAATLLVTTGDNPGRVRREASFAALCGASPVDASSGKQLRHRLNRGGDRLANSALWTIAMTRLAHDPRPRTKAYKARRTTEGKTSKEIIRCLKRYIAREIYNALCRPNGQEMPSTPQIKQDLSVRVLT
jgi:transposase